MSERGPIDFVGLARALLDRADTLVPQWLREGVRRGHEWVCGDLSGAKGESCSVNLNTGAWGDFASGETGGDLISLYAAIHGLNNGQAARQLMRELGWEREPVQAPARPRQPAGSAAGQDRPEPPPADGGQPADERRDTKWRPIQPVPEGTPQPRLRHWHHGDPSHTWRYERDGVLWGYVCRFATPPSAKRPNGGKEVLPLTWCEDTSDGRGTRRWEWKQWDEPRPLYLAAGLLASEPALVPVVLVEGEKCADAGHALLPAEYDWVSWPGGGNAWERADWSWLRGRTVILWPDCDAKRAKLSADERKAGVDPLSKPLLEEARQPGVRAMTRIGSVLQADMGCNVLMCKLPAPGAVADGWDVADAIEQGWTAEQVRGFIEAARPFQAPDDAARAKATPTPSIAGASEEEAARAWRSKLILSSTGAIKACRENVVLALDGLPEEGLSGVPEAMGVIAFNEFTNDVIKTRDTPWGTLAGVWDEVDELEMGNWLTRTHWLPSMPRGTLEEAVAMVAKRHRFHPVRQELDRLRGTWDGSKRLGTWLRRTCLEEDEWDDADPLQQYLSRVGAWVLMAICARVLTPGCKFDYMMILEGPQGHGKSTLARILGGEYFADTGLVLGDKDSYQNLQGVLVYEWGELDSLNKAEVTKVKQFISSQKDRFRASFDRRPKDYPRQVIFIGTTNEDHYLVDPTGNRRFWPVRITRHIDLAWLRENRDQLFAEALTYVEQGHRFHPTPAEQRDLFDAQQQQRQIENAIQAAVMRYLYDQGQRVSVTGENGTLVNEISGPELLGRLGISVDKQTHVLLRQVTAALRQAGWVRFRSSRGDRPWMFRRPASESRQGVASASPSFNGSTQSHQPDEELDGCPF